MQCATVCGIVSCKGTLRVCICQTTAFPKSRIFPITSEEITFFAFLDKCRIPQPELVTSSGPWQREQKTMAAAIAARTAGGQQRQRGSMYEHR